jgi:hypothetical protein
MRIHGNVPLPPACLVSQEFQSVLSNAEEVSQILRGARVGVYFNPESGCYIARVLSSNPSSQFQLVSVTI